MSATQEQMAADFAAVLADPHGPADTINVNGTDLQGIRQQVDWLPATDLEGAQVEREQLFLLQSALGFVPVPWQELVVDGYRWSVESVPGKGPVLELIMVRYAS